MKQDSRALNVIGALALALADDLSRAAQARAPEAGSAAAALALLDHEPGMAIERLRRALGLSHPGAVRLVDRLTADGLVIRKPAERDRRAVALHLTDTGAMSARAILSARGESLRRGLATLSAKERDTFAALAETMLRGILRGEDHAYALCRLCDQSVCADCPVEAELARIGSGAHPAEAAAH